MKQQIEPQRIEIPIEFRTKKFNGQKVLRNKDKKNNKLLLDFTIFFSERAIYSFIWSWKTYCCFSESRNKKIPLKSFH